MTRRRKEEELERDIREHLEMETRDNLERGMPPEEARAAALRKFGNVARIQEDTREVWGWTRVEQIFQDFRYALRMLRKNPGFATVTIVTLALGIGMNTAVFSVVNAVLLKPLPYPHAERLVWLADYIERFNTEVVSGADFLDWKQQAQSFEKMVAYGAGSAIIVIKGNADQESTDVVLVNETFARLILGAGDPIGRRVRIPSRQPAPVAAIAGVVADLKTTKLDAEPVPEIYIPYRQSPFVRSHDVVVKMAGNPLTMAAALREKVASIDRTQPVFHVQTLEQALADSISPRRFNLFMLGVFAVVAVILGAVGIYGVMSGMVTQRTREIGVRMALGAQQSEVLRMVVRQGMWVSAAGILGGMAASLALTRLMGSLLFEVTPTDPPTFAAVCLVLGAAAMVACCAPAIKASRVDPIIALRYE